ncbi:MAG: hypothetical protein HY332_23880 [Chloroflexi bacterium]|nr:hypothetical protein [Chloroflexota bacterium]
MPKAKRLPNAAEIADQAKRGIFNDSLLAGTQLFDLSDDELLHEPVLSADAAPKPKSPRLPPATRRRKHVA